MADGKKTKKLREMGPPRLAALPLTGRALTDPEKEQYYQEALEDVAEALETSPEKLSENIAEKRFVSFPTTKEEVESYGYFDYPKKKLMIRESGHKTPEEWKDTARHEIAHSAGVGHSKPKRTRETQWEPEESYYYRPALMQEPTKNPETGKLEDTLERDRKLLKVMKEIGTENPEKTLAYTKVINELFGHGQHGMAERAKTGMPLEIFAPPLEERTEQVSETYSPEWEEKSKRVKRLRERAYPDKRK